MAALMGLRNVFVYTHDSIGLGEDGPTHQAIEHAASLRLIPNLCVWRPFDAGGAAVAWSGARERATGPPCCVLARAGLGPHPSNPGAPAGRPRRGHGRGEVGIGADGVNWPVAEKSGLCSRPQPTEVSLIVRQVLDLPAEQIEDRFALQPGEGVILQFGGLVNAPPSSPPKLGGKEVG